MSSGPLLTPATENHLFNQMILSPFLSGENLTITWVAHGGRKKTMVYLTENAGKFGFDRLGKYQILYIDHDQLTEEMPTAYFQLMLRNLMGNTSGLKYEEEPFFTLKEEAEKLLQQDFHLIFILGRFDELNLPVFFFNNLYSLWQINKAKVHFIFAITKNIFQEEHFKQYGQLREAICQNIAYFPIHNDEDIKVITATLIEKYGYKISPDQIKKAQILGGGHPSLTKACLRIMNSRPDLNDEKLIDFLGQQWEIKTVLEDMWQCFGEEEKAFLSIVVKSNHTKIENIPSSLVQLRIVICDKDTPRLFSPLFQTFVMNKKVEVQSLTLDPKNGEILINGCPPQEKISLQEYHLLATFLSKPQVLLSRDQIAEVLWGKDSYDKYSDWAIDQIVSQLRRKLEQLGISSKNLQTIRGRGYRWIPS